MDGLEHLEVVAGAFDEGEHLLLEERECVGLVAVVGELGQEGVDDLVEFDAVLELEVVVEVAVIFEFDVGDFIDFVFR